MTNPNHLKPGYISSAFHSDKVRAVVRKFGHIVWIEPLSSATRAEAKAKALAEILRNPAL